MLCPCATRRSLWCPERRDHVSVPWSFQHGLDVLLNSVKERGKTFQIKDSYIRCQTALFLTITRSESSNTYQKAWASSCTSVKLTVNYRMKKVTRRKCKSVSWGVLHGGQNIAVFTRDTFTWGKLTFLLYCIRFCYYEMHLPHVNVSRLNMALFWESTRPCVT